MTTTPMLTYHNDPAVKAKYVQRFAEHRAADAVIQGQGYDNGRGCFVGCTLQSYNHSRFPVELGWPEWLARLADVIFEGLPKAEAPSFGTDLLAAMPVGVDVERLWIPLAIARHERSLVRLAGNDQPYAIQCRAAIQGVIDWLKAGAPEHARAAARSAAASAWSAAWSAESAAWSAESAAAAARSAADSAESAAESAAWSAESAARSAEGEESQAERDTLLTILRGL